MTTVDLRTRSDGHFHSVDLGSFVDEQLARVLEAPRPRGGSGGEPARARSAEL